MRHVADAAQFDSRTLSPARQGLAGNCPDHESTTMHDDQQPTNASTPGEIIDYYDTHLNLTLRELSAMTGRSVTYLKGLLLHPEKVAL